MSASKITRLLTDATNPNSMASRARRRRWRRLAEIFDLASMTVIDLGGLVDDWRRAPVRPRNVVVVNLFEQSPAPGIEAIVADACSLPAGVGSFDLVYSNSVIDLVGGHARRLQFAEAVRDLSPHHWIQTAYRYFPIDAYSLFPFQQSLPLHARAFVVRHWPLGYRHASGLRESVLINLSVESLSASALGAYFPDSEILRERWCGLTKSLIACR